LQIVEEVAPKEGDIMLPKTAPSAFFGTPLVKFLNTLQVDTLFMIGNTTSGCIRASVVDGVSYDYKVVVPHDGCYDRAPVCHAVNLFDIASKYADVVSTTEAIAMLKAMAGSKTAADVGT
jgi:maleamate amidohydrolase